MSITNTIGQPQQTPMLMLRKRPNPVLLADPSMSFLESLWIDREAQQAPPVFVQSAKEAQLVLAQYKEGFSGIFINPDLSKPGGINIIRAAHHHQPAVPIFLVIDHPEKFDQSLFTEENLQDLGIQKVLVKPITYAEILKLVTPAVDLFDPDDALEVAKKNIDPLEKEVEAKDTSFFRVRTANFLSGTKVFFDTYIQISPSRYVKVLRAGDSFSLDRIRGYLSKGVTHFYLKKEAQEHYVNFCDKLVLAILKSPKIPASVKISQTFHHGQETLQFLMDRGISKSSLEYAAGYVANVEHLVKQLNLADLSTLGPFMKDLRSYEHGVSTSIISSMITRALGIEHEKAVYTGGLASLLHDVGLQKLPPHLRDEDESKMTDSERETYLKHPLTGAQILQGVPGLDPVIAQIVEQHHERRNRSGFPRQLGASHILQFSEIVGISDILLKLIEIHTKNPEIDPFVEMVTHYDGFSPVVVTAFRNAFRLGRI